MVNNSNFILGEIPKFHPIVEKYNRLEFFKTVKRRIFEGYWVGGRWCPPELYYHVNLSTIQFLGGGRKIQGIGQPWFRDIEWEKAFIYSEACGFSGFINDPEYTCLRDIQTMSKEQINSEYCIDNYGNRIDKNYHALFTSTSELKKYMPAREYFWRTNMSSDFGKALYLNGARNVIDLESRSSGKDISNYQRLVYSDGSRRPIKDCVVGDRIFGDDGKITTIIQRRDFNDQMQYRVKLQDGRTVDCGGGHLWSVRQRDTHTGDYKEQIKTTIELLKDYKYSRGESKYYIKNSEPLQYPEKELPIEPYFLGLWLGDGNSHNTGITTMDKEIVDYLSSYAERLGVQLSVYAKHKNAPVYAICKTGNGYRPNELLHKLIELNVIKNKHIPDIYLTSSIEQRLELLRGLMDSDGHIGTNGTVDISTSYDGLKSTIPLLTRSLGIRTFAAVKKTKCKDSLRIHLNTNLCIFNLSRKINRITNPSGKSINYRKQVAIVDISEIGVLPSVCIAVDNKNSLFLVEDFVVTHNSYWSSSCIQHNLLTDGARDYDGYLEGRKTGKLISISQTLVGAIESKYSADLLSKAKFSLEHLPGEVSIRLNGEDKTFPSPIMPELGGSWESGAKNPIHDMLSGSSIIHRTFQDNPLAANGTRPTRAFIEEVGFVYSIQEILGAVEATQANRETNKYLPIYMLGTGGYTTTGTALWLKEIFYNPEAYDCLAFDDVWENKGKIGYFVPATKGLNDFKEGPNLVSNEARALKTIELSREKAQKSNNKIKVLTTIINQPIKPSEVFMTIDGNFFPVEDLRHCLEVLEASPTILNQTYKVEFQMIDGKPYPKASTKPVIRDFPIKKGISMDSAIEIYEMPVRLSNNNEIPNGRYLAGWDPVEVDGNDDYSQSLQSVYVLDSWTDRIVADYTGRTYIATDFYEQARRLFTYYNALSNYENNLKGPYAHFLNKNSLHLMCDTPEILSDKSIVKIQTIGNKSKGTRVSGNSSGSGVISYGINEILAWLESPAYDKPEGVRVMDTIKSPALLRELINYSPQINCDRVSALILLMILRADRQRITEVSKTQSIKTKASDPLFTRAYKTGRYASKYSGLNDILRR